MNEDAERFVIDSACNGSQQAWCRLFEWHFDAVYRFCLVLAGGRRELAEEVSQQTFIIAARRIRRFRPDRATFRAWLHGIARNRYLTLVTREPAAGLRCGPRYTPARRTELGAGRRRDAVRPLPWHGPGCRRGR